MRYHTMYFYEKVCDNYHGRQTIINEVNTTPYLAHNLQTDLTDHDLVFNRCASAYHYDRSDNNPFIVDILVDSPGSYYWSNQ